MVPVDAACAVGWEPLTGAGIPLPFVGRTVELARLDERLRDVHAGRGAMVLLEGEAGIESALLLVSGGADDRQVVAGELDVRGGGGDLWSARPLGFGGRAGTGRGREPADSSGFPRGSGGGGGGGGS